MMEKQIILRKLMESRKALHQAIQGINEAVISTQIVEGVWTSKDLIAHINSWELAFLIPLRQFAQDGKFVPESITNHNLWNEQQARLWYGNPLSILLSELESTRQEIYRLCEGFDDKDWTQILPAPWGGTETLAEMISGLAWHENEHVKSIIQYRNGR